MGPIRLRQNDHKLFSAPAPGNVGLPPLSRRVEPVEPEPGHRPDARKSR